MSNPSLFNLHCLTLPTPYSVGDVNVYLVEPGQPHDPLTLLDTGPDWEAAENALWQGLAQHGYAVQNLGQILISHPHPDHYGLAAKLRQASGAAVCAHPHGQATLAAGQSNHRHTLAFYQHWLTECGAPPAVQLKIDQARQDTHGYAQAVTVDRFLNDGDSVQMGGREWQVLATPGHSGGMLCFFEPESRTLLASDHLIADISSNPVVEPPPAGQTERPKRLLQYLQQLERVADLRPVIAYAGHGPPVTDVEALVRERKAFHQTRAEQLLHQLGGRPQTIYQLSTSLFRPDLPALHLFLALSEVQGHLDLLQAAGQVYGTAEGDRLWWQAAG